MCNKAETANVGCKVFPFLDAPKSNSSTKDISDGIKKEEKNRSNQKKAVLLVKEMLKRAASAAAMSPGRKWKALQSRRKVEQKDPLDDSSSTSSKIGGRFSVSSSLFSLFSLGSRDEQMWAKSFSRLSVASQSREHDINISDCLKSEDYVRNAQWITTDAEFVVLEL